MKAITIDFEHILTNKIFLATLSAIIAVLFLFLDKCIFIKQVEYISYIKLFVLVFCIVFSVLYFVEKYSVNDMTDLHDDLSLDKPNF